MRLTFHNKWKYSTIGLMAVLAVGFSFPQAFAHVTNSLSHNVTHILDALGAIQSDVDDIKTAVDNSEPKVIRGYVSLDNLINTEQSFQIIGASPPSENTIYSGHITIANYGGPLILTCHLIDTNDTFPFDADEESVLAEVSGQVSASVDFNCNGLTLQTADSLDFSRDAVYAAEYWETTDALEIDNTE